jgi:outer membrane protein assembly factor BamB
VRCAGLFAFVMMAASAADWPMPNGNSQRNGWARSEHLINKSNVRQLQLLYKYQTDNVSKGQNSLTSPIISGNLITYRGFKEMLLFAGSSDKVFSVDADLNALLWESQMQSVGSKPASGDPPSANCAGGLTAPIIMAGSSSSAMRFAAEASQIPAGAPVTVRRRRPSPYLPSLAQSIYPMLPTTLTQLNVMYAVSSDGYLHIVNSSTGEDLIPAIRFVAPNAKVTSLNLRDNVVYATTADNCDGYQNALFAMDLLDPQKRINSFAVSRGGFAGTAGTVIGSDGTVYVQVAFAPSEKPEYYRDTIVALTPKDLKVKDYFTPDNKPMGKKEGGTPGITPVVFSFMGRDVVLAGADDGRLFLLDSRSLGGTDHRTPLFASAELVRKSKNDNRTGYRGVFSTWWDVDTGMRWFYAPVFGSLQQSGKSNVSSGHILALKLAGTNERPTLETVWTSRSLASPTPAVIANGMVFVLDQGTGASLYALDAITGTELFASGNTGASVSPSAELALANGRVYFTGASNYVYCFGIPSQHTQLVKQ